MSQFPPGAAGPIPMYGPPRRANGMAIAGLVCSILGFCVVYIGGLLGIIFGLIGLKRSARPEMGGRGLSVAAILVGILSLLASVGYSYYGFKVYQSAAKMAETIEQDVARRFVQNLSQNDVDAAAGECTPNLTAADLRPMAQKLHALGSLKDMTSPQINIENNNGAVTCRLRGVATFASGNQSYDITVIHTGHGTWKVSKAEFP